ncbi:M23 family metallopeptidase [Sphaerisporangium fuscum]|uniref:M23 family metallopeptidase n=1 Tax=Sphaerisporangium fuscum TaxID=2835868 RepID=UPI0027E3A0B4|nr:M23 family metallopeptidase [Sphaerisporangium fuscum]
MANAAQRAAGPNFQLPFPCGETWVGSSKSFAHTGNEIDFNGSANDGNGDLGRTVVAAAAGKVEISAYQTNNGFGNLVKIRHADGSATLYAHLNSRTVAQGASVAQGQKIGTVGHSSAKYKIVAHLHYEQRSAAGAIVRATFNGVPFRYPNQTVTSKNCGGGTSKPPTTGGPDPANPANPYSAGQVCGAGFKEIDSQFLGPVGRVVLLYSASSGENCVVTLRDRTNGKVSASAYLEVKGQARKTDSGSFQYYAGPVRSKAAKTCVKWGGSIGSAEYDSPLEHCG